MGPRPQYDVAPDGEQLVYGSMGIQASPQTSALTLDTL